MANRRGFYLNLKFKTFLKPVSSKLTHVTKTFTSAKEHIVKTLLFLILVQSFLQSLKFPDTTKIGFSTAPVLGLCLALLSFVFNIIILGLAGILFILTRG